MSHAQELSLTGALLCLTAVVFGVPALYIPGVAALLAPALATGWVTACAARTRVQLGCGELAVQEGDMVPVAVSIRRGRVPFPAATVVPWPSAREVTVPREREIRANALLARRGLQEVGPARVRVADPLGICVREILSDSSEVLVLPRVHPLSAPFPAMAEGSGISRREAPQEVDALRVYRPGSPASRIHWPTVARSGVLMEHSLRAEDDARVLLEVDALHPASEEALDQALRAAASLCVHLARRGGCMVLLPDDARASAVGPDLRGWPALHARLALIRAGEGARRTRRARSAPSLIHVTASTGAQSGGGAHLRVSPVPLAGLPVTFTVAGCCCQHVGATLSPGSP